MGAPAEHPAFPRDAWPTIELKRMPNGEMGVMLEFPAPPELVSIGFDTLAMNMEPRRVETMHANIADVLDALGLARSLLKSKSISLPAGKLFPAERYSNNPLDLVALSDARGEVERLKRENTVSERRLTDLARRASGFTTHANVCQSLKHPIEPGPRACTCGLDGLRKEIEAL